MHFYRYKIVKCNREKEKEKKEEEEKRFTQKKTVIIRASIRFYFEIFSYRKK